MRLSPASLQAITDSVRQRLPELQYRLYLYGSWVNDALKGGDIDLLLLVRNMEDKIEAEALKYKILVSIKNKIGDQKIDLCVYVEAQIGNEPFLDLILPGAELILES